MYKGLKRTAAAALAAVLAVTALAGCSKKEQAESEAAAAAAAEAEAKAMVSLGDASVSAGAFNFMLRYNMATDWMSSFYRSIYGQDIDVWAYDMYGNGEIYGDTVKNNVLHEVQHLLLEQAHMDEYGVSLSDEEKAAITEAAKAFIDENDPEILASMSATQENVEQMLTLRTIQNKMEKAMAADVDTNVSDEEAAQRAVSYVSFTASTEAETEEETEELSEAVQAVEAADLEEAATEAALQEETAVEMAAETETEVHAEMETDVKTKSSDETEALAETEEAAAEAAEPESEAGTEAETEDPAMVAAREKAMADAQAFLESVKGMDTDAFEEAAAQASENGSHTSNGEWTFGSDSTYPDAQIIEATEGLADGTLVDHVIVVDDTYYVVFVTSAFDREATDERKEEIVEERRQARITSLLETWEGGSEEAETSDETEGAAPVEAAEFTIDEEAFAALSFDYLLYPEAETEEEFEEVMTEELTEGLTEGGTEVVTAG